MNETSTRWALALLAAGAVVCLPWGFSGYVVPKLVLVSCAVLVGLWPRRRNAQLPRAAFLVVGLGLLWLGVSTLASSHPLTAINGRWPRYEGLPVLGLYVAAAVLGARLLGTHGSDPAAGDRHGPRTAWLSLHRALAVAALLVACVAGVQVLLQTLSSGGPRPGATFGNASELAIWSVVVLGVLLPRAVEGGDRLIRAGSAAATLTVAIAGSRAGYLGLLVVAVVVFFGRQSQRRAVATRLGAGLGGVVLLALAIPAVRGRLLDTSTMSGRLTVWEESARLLADRPVTGVGLGGYVDAIPAHHSLAYARSVGMSEMLDSPHLWPLQAAAAGGLPVLLLALLAAAAVFLLGVRAVHRAEPARRPYVLGALAGCTAYGVALMTHFTSPATTPLAALLAGALISVPVKEQSPRPPRHWPTRVGLVAITAFVALSVVADTLVGHGLAQSEQMSARADTTTFDTAAHLTPWNADIPGAAAQSFGGRAADGDAPAADLALTYADRALRLTPDSVEVALAKGVALNALARYGEAKELLTQLDEAAPHHYVVLTQRAISNYGSGDTAAALSDLRVAAQAAPGSPLPWVVRARIHHAMGNDAAAEGDLAQARQRANAAN